MASDHPPTPDSSEHLVPSMANDYSSRSDPSDLLFLPSSPDSTSLLIPLIENYYSLTSNFPAKEKQTYHIPQKQEANSVTRKDATYKIKEIQYLGKKRQIVLQNENGPCPLIAICNILLLKNCTTLNPDIFEVSEEKLLHLVTEELIYNNDDDEMSHLSSSLWENNAEEYIANQKQKIDEAMDRLQSIADGINVDLKFRRIDDFEFTPDLAIFGLLSIPLYHGWLVDPQDCETSIAIGCKSYNDLMTELVGMETHAKGRSGPFSGECSVEFSTAQTASIGVHSPCFSKTRLFADSPPASAEPNILGKGDFEENIALLRALRLSEKEAIGFDIRTSSCSEGESMYGFLDENPVSEDDTLETSVDATAGCSSILGSIICQQSKSDDSFFDATADCDVKNKTKVGEEVRSKCSGVRDHDRLSPKELGDESVFDVETEKNSKISAVDMTSSEAVSEGKTDLESTKNGSTSEMPLKPEAVTSVNQDLSERSQDGDVPALYEEKTDLESTKNGSTSEMPLKSEAVTFVNQDISERSKDDDVALNESEGSVSLDSPAYEGESLLGEYSSEGMDPNKLKPKEGEVIKRFLEDYASQLTFHGLDSLVKGIKEGELCVFFRNNHFSTMLKYENELYLLVTDQGYLTQRDVVWEKLNEVNGNSVFVAGNFQVFNSDRSETRIWDQSNAITHTADYICKVNSTSNEGGGELDPDLKMAIELQEQELVEVSDPYFT